MASTVDGENGSIVKMQDPNETIKPEVNINKIPDLIWSLYGLKATKINELPSYDDRNYFFLADTSTCNNANIPRINQHGYVFKVLNSLQSSSPEIIADGRRYGQCLVRVVTFVPGKVFHVTPYVSGSFYNVGRLVGKLHSAIADGFHHSFYDTYQTIWSLEEVTSLREFYQAVSTEKDLLTVKNVVDEFEKNILPKFGQFTKGTIHGDINEQNLIMEEVPDQSDVPLHLRVHDVCALLDFADVTQSCFIFDVAIAITYLSIECDDESQLDVGGHLLAGYCEFRKLNETELNCLQGLVCSRLCQSLVYGAHSYAQQPGNEYLLTTSKRGWPLLHKYWGTDHEQLLARWRRIIDSYKSK